MPLHGMTLYRMTQNLKAFQQMTIIRIAVIECYFADRHSVKWHIRMLLSKMTLSRTSLCIVDWHSPYIVNCAVLWYSAECHSSNCLGATTLSLKGLFSTLSINDTQLSIFETNYAECRYAEWRYAECRGAIELIKVCKTWVIQKVFTSLSWLDLSPNLSSMS